MPTTVTVELKGHLIDSLTLAKVIDLIQAEADAKYKMDFIDVGYEKNDFSIAHLRITTPDDSHMEVLLDKLKTYGAVPFTDNDTSLEPCPRDGEPPQEAMFMEGIHERAMVDGQWVPLQKPAHMTHVLRYDPESRHLAMTYVDTLKQGDMVVVLSKTPSTAAYNMLK
jgi:hypothetical protein